MSRVLYFDCFSGVSGDMVLGALLDAGLPLDELKAALGSLAVSGDEVDACRVLRAGVSATKFVVDEHGDRDRGAASTQRQPPHQPRKEPHKEHSHDRPHHDHHHGEGHAPHGAPVGIHDTSRDAPFAQRSHPHRSLPEIFGLIEQSALSAGGRARAKAMFQRLAEAEASIHQMPVERVHLHEVGALDSIIDIVGAVFALEWFKTDQILSSPLNVGGGMVDTAHGHFPVPAPATLKLLGDTPIYGGRIQKELVTPTGALIISSYVSAFGPMPAMTVDAVGYGAGDRDFPSTPNVLRVLVGRAEDRSGGDRVVVVECEIDDMNPQLFGVVMERLYAAGALEVFYAPVQMKKNRPGTLLTAIAAPGQRARLAEIIFRETTTIGLRYHEVDRECLQRELVTVETPAGPIRVKVARHGGRVVNAVPEFDDCASAAATHNLAVKEVQALAVRAFGSYQDRPL